ncbi:hypothetical protein ScalyP_jg11119 [Parmales sp. scaly parma]|nr:hypothetical protein ScalyP_jg11119 [Parmales sp. scaly parma]
MAYAMGTRVRFNQVDETGVSTWECGQILGVHDEGTFDVFLSTGEGKMNVAPDQLKIDETAVSETFTSSSAAMAQPKAKTTSIGWNPGAFGDEGDDVEEEDAPAPAPAPKSSGGFAFAVGDRCEIKDYQTKSYRASKLTEVDEDIGTVAAIYEDNGEEGKGIPLGLVRKCKDRDKKKKEKSGAAAAGGDNVLQNIVDLLKTLNSAELNSTLEIVRQVKAISSQAQR